MVSIVTVRNLDSLAVDYLKDVLFIGIVYPGSPISTYLYIKLAS